MTRKKTPSNPVDLFIHILGLMAGNIKKLADCYMICISDDHIKEFKRKVLDSNLSPDSDFLLDLKRVGEGDLLPEIVSSHSDLAAVLKPFPVEVQRKYFLKDQRVTVYAKDGTKKSRNPSKMSNFELKQVFDTRNLVVRRKNIQIAYLNNLSQKRSGGSKNSSGSSKNSSGGSSVTTPASDHKNYLEESAQYKIHNGEVFITDIGKLEKDVLLEIMQKIMMGGKPSTRHLVA